MPEVPKIVHSRLRAGAPDGGHPDPDVLTAFAEQALSSAEREGVLQHLAVCRECREVIAVALPANQGVLAPLAAPAASEAAATPVRRERVQRNWFGWLGLRGAAVAAGVVVVASVLMLHPGKQLQPKVEKAVVKVNSQPEPTSETTAAKPAAAPIERLFTDTAKSDELRANKDEAGQAKLKSEYSYELKTSRAGKPAESAKMQPSAAPGDMKRADRREADEPASMATPPATAGAVSRSSVSQPAGVSASADLQAPPASTQAVTAKAATGTVEVTGTSPLVQTTDATANENLSLTARNMEVLPIEKAKAPVPSQKAALAARTKKQALGASGNYAAALQAAPEANWRLSEGHLERSLGVGLSWQTVLRSDHILLCHAVRGNDIWAGGQAGTLFHSTDGGATWTQLHPAVKDQQLTADITGIELQKPGQAAVSTGSGESWITADNGKTWTKK